MHLTKHLVPGLLAAVLTLAGAAQAASLTRQPYLQKVGPDTATVAFRLDANCAPSVRYGANGATDQSVTSPDAGRIHAVVLNGLTPGTEYSYVVDACGGQTSPKRFRTAPVPGTRRVHFAAVGDMGTNGTQQKAVARGVLAARPELYVTLGDNAYSSGTEAEFQSNFFAPMEDLLAEVPLFTSPGNHEYVTNQAQPYLDNLYLPTNNPKGSERYYSFDWGHVHFVSLDSNCAIGLASKDRCTLAEMKAWLEQDLAASQQPWKVVFFHHPPWSSGDHGSQLAVRRELVPLFEKYNVDVALESDGHVLKRTLPIRGEKHDPSGVVYVGEGGLGVPQRTPSSQWYLKAPGMAKSAHHVQVLSFSPEKLVYEAKGMTGTLEDTYTFQPRRTGTVEVPAPAAPAIEAVTARSDTQVAVTFSLDMDGATAGLPTAYQLAATQPNAPDVQVRDVAVESPRTFVLSTTRLTEGGDYALTAKGVRSSSGATAAQPLTASFKVPGVTPAPVPTEPTPTEPEPTEPEPTGPVDPLPAPPVEPRPPSVVPPQPEQPRASGCTAAAGSSLLWAGAAVCAGVARRRRRTR